MLTRPQNCDIQGGISSRNLLNDTDPPIFIPHFSKPSIFEMITITKSKYDQFGRGAKSLYLVINEEEVIYYDNMMNGWWPQPNHPSHLAHPSCCPNY